RFEADGKCRRDSGQKAGARWSARRVLRRGHRGRVSLTVHSVLCPCLVSAEFTHGVKNPHGSGSLSKLWAASIQPEIPPVSHLSSVTGKPLPASGDSGDQPHRQPYQPSAIPYGRIRTPAHANR